MPTIDIYTTPQCGFCKQLKSLLDAEGKQYTAHDVTASEEDLKEMQKLSDGAMSVPVLVLDKGAHAQKVGIGFEEAKKLLGKNAETASAGSEKSMLTCPKCGHKQEGAIPTTSCVPFYVCDDCKKTIKAAGEDCCVFCSYGDKPCPIGNKPKGGCSNGSCSL